MKRPNLSFGVLAAAKKNLASSRSRTPATNKTDDLQEQLADARREAQSALAEWRSYPTQYYEEAWLKAVREGSTVGSGDSKTQGHVWMEKIDRVLDLARGRWALLGRLIQRIVMASRATYSTASPPTWTAQSGSLLITGYRKGRTPSPRPAVTLEPGRTP